MLQNAVGDGLFPPESSGFADTVYESMGWPCRDLQGNDSHLPWMIGIAFIGCGSGFCPKKKRNLPSPSQDFLNGVEKQFKDFWEMGLSQT